MYADTTINNKAIINNHKILFVISCILTALFLLMRDIFDMGIPKLIFVVISLMLALFSDINHIFLYISFITPVSTGLPYSYIFMIFLVILAIKRPEWILNIKMVPLYIIIFIIEPLSIFFGEFSIVEYMRMLSILIVVFAYIYNYSDQCGAIKACKLYLTGFCIAGIDILIKTISSAGIPYLLAWGVRLGNISDIISVEGMAVTFNANTLAILSSIAIAVSMVLLQGDSGNKLWYFITIVFSVFIGISTMSRTFIMLAAIILVIYSITSAKTLKGYLSIISILILLVLFFLILNSYYPAIIQNLMKRFVTSDLSNGRIDVFMYYMQKIFDEPAKFIFGLGLQKYQIKSEVYFSCHNGIQEIFVTWGLIGSVLVAILFINIYRSKKNNLESINKIRYLPFAVLMIGIQTVQFFSQYIYIMALLVTVSCTLVSKRYRESRINEIQQ